MYEKLDEVKKFVEENRDKFKYRYEMMKAISEKFGISLDRANRYLSLLGVRFRNTSRKRKILEWIRKNKDKFENRIEMVRAVSEKFNLAPTTASAYILYAGVKFSNHKKRVKEFLNNNVEKIRELANKGHSLNQIAKELGVAPSTFKVWFWRYGKEVFGIKIRRGRPVDRMRNLHVSETNVQFEFGRKWFFETFSKLKPNNLKYKIEKIDPEQNVMVIRFLNEVKE